MIGTFLVAKNPEDNTEDKNLPANAGDTVLIPGPGRFHMPWSN
jgi:hypothetical protein